MFNLFLYYTTYEQFCQIYEVCVRIFNLISFYRYGQLYQLWGGSKVTNFFFMNIEFDFFWTWSNAKFMRYIIIDVWYSFIWYIMNNFCQIYEYVYWYILFDWCIWTIVPDLWVCLYRCLIDFSLIYMNHYAKLVKWERLHN